MRFGRTILEGAVWAAPHLEGAIPVAVARLLLRDVLILLAAHRALSLGELFKHGQTWLWESK